MSTQPPTENQSKMPLGRVVTIAILVVVLIGILISGFFIFKKSEQPLALDAADTLLCQADRKVVHPQAAESDKAPSLGSDPNTKDAIGTAEPAQYAQGRGIWVKGGKVLDNAQINQAIEDKLPIVELYFDYTCNFCNDLEKAHREEFEKLAEDGKAVLVYRPVLTHNGPMAMPGNEVAVWVAAHNPDKFVAFQQALSKITSTYLTTEQLTKIQDVQNKYLDSSGTSIDQTKLCDAVNAGDDMAKTLLYASDPFAAVDQALQDVGLDPKQVPLPKEAEYSRAASEYFSNRVKASGGSAGTPKVLINGTEATAEQLQDPEGITKALKDK